MNDFGDFERMIDLPDGKKDSASVRIFVVDDEPEIVEILSDLVSSLGYSVSGFTDPLEMLKAFQVGAPDLILTDHRMPTLSGTELLRRVKEIDPEIPIVIVSGYLDRKDFIDAISAGVFAVVEKPFDADRVTQVCKNGVALAQATRLLNRSLNLLLFHCDDIRAYLVSQGKAQLADTIHEEISQLVDQRRKIQLVSRG
jgi:DNA-binding NtrC family response regulator